MSDFFTSRLKISDEKVNGELQWTWNQAYRLSAHIGRVEIPHYRREARLTPDSNRDLRIRRLTKDIDDAKWQSLLLSRVKKREKATEYLEAFQMFADSFDALANNAFINPYERNDSDRTKNFLLQSRALMRLADYFNKHMCSMHVRYKNQYPQIMSLTPRSSKPKRGRV